MRSQAQTDDAAFSEPAFTADTLLNGTVRIRQPASGYRAAIDPVFLAAGVPARAGQHILDAGCGAGAAFLCLARRIPECSIVGVERDPLFADLARFNAADNGFSDRIRIVTGDVAGPLPDLVPGACDHVMINPPHLDPERSRPSADRARAAAMVEEMPGISAWIAFAHRMLRDGGTLTLIHRVDRLEDVLAALGQGFGAVIQFPLLPMTGRAAKRVLVRAQKNAAAAATVLPGLVLHAADGRYTPAAEEILRGGRGLDF
jgi:tRNA1(Val) A37 N6-methylase TrmN6